MPTAEDDLPLGAGGAPAPQAIEVDFNNDDEVDSDLTLEPDMVPFDTVEQREEGLMGLPLLDVYSVRFLKKDEKYLLPHIFGVITVEGASGASIIYNRKIGECRGVDSEGLMKLCDKRRGVKVDGDIFIKPYVFGAKFLYRYTESPQRLWRAKSNKCQYDKLLVTKINSDLGPIEVQYAVYMEATEAVVAVTFNDLKGGKKAEIVGTIKAWNNRVSGAVSCIFDENDIFVDLRKSKSACHSVLLSRCGVVVPCKSDLFVQVDIRCGNAVFPNKTIKFCSGIDEVRTIYGIDGMVAVKVTWLKNVCSDKLQGWTMGAENNDIHYRLSDSSFRPLKMPRLSDAIWSTLRHYSSEDVTRPVTSYSHPAAETYIRLELFSMRFVCHEKLDVSKIYGTFMLDVGSTKFVLYNRKVGDPPHIDSKGFVMLTVPRHAMVVAGCIEVFHYLFDLESMVIPEHIQWWDAVRSDPSCDKLLTEQVDSEFGPIELAYATYLPAAEASLEVVLLNCEYPDEVYGYMKAKNDVVNDLRAVSWLFNSEKKEAVGCTYNDNVDGSVVTNLPLLRRVVVVPRPSKMILDVNISNGGKTFAFGELRFDAMSYGTECKFLKDVHGNDKIRVKVSWGYACHDESMEYCW